MQSDSRMEVDSNGQSTSLDSRCPALVADPPTPPHLAEPLRRKGRGRTTGMGTFTILLSAQLHPACALLCRTSRGERTSCSQQAATPAPHADLCPAPLQHKMTTTTSPTTQSPLTEQSRLQQFALNAVSFASLVGPPASSAVAVADHPHALIPHSPIPLRTIHLLSRSRRGLDLDRHGRARGSIRGGPAGQVWRVWRHQELAPQPR